MKKRIVLIALLVLVLVCLTACGNVENTLTAVTTLLKEDYSNVTINVTTETSNVTLQGVYSLSFDGDKTTIEYSYDKLNELDIDGNNAGSYKTTISGTAVVQGNTVTENGVPVELPAGPLDYTGLSFKEGFFNKARVSNGSFSANVRNPKGFTGNNDFVCSNMRVEVKFTTDSLSEINITYVSANGNNVTVVYWFTK